MKIPLSLICLLAAAPLCAQFNPFFEIKTELFYTGENYRLLENRDGTILRQGLNLFVYQNGRFGREKFSANYSLKQTVRESEKKFEIHKLNASFRAGKFSLEIGKDNAQSPGPGENKLLLSENSAPYLLVKAENAVPLRLAGDWNFFILNGWLNENRNDVSNPKIFFARLSYAPAGFIELSAERSTMYGGAGRPEYKIWEYPALLLGKDENITGDRFDNDGFFAWDISIRVPPEKLGEKIKKLKIYYQDAGTDASAFWQTEDKKYYFPLGVKLRLHAYLAGILMETEKHSFRLEFAATNPLFYTHHWYYDEGYSYKGACLGHPYGRNMKNFSLSHETALKENFSLEYKLGIVILPAFNETNKMKRYYFSADITKNLKKITVGGYLRLDKTNNYDSDDNPNQYAVSGKDEFFVTTGISAAFAF